MVKVDPTLISRVWDKRNRLGARISDKIVDSVEKYAMANLDKAFMEQDSGTESLNQELVKFHLYHWLYDCVATLDAIACLFNMRFGVLQNSRSVSMNDKFIRNLEERSQETGAFLRGEFGWMKELKDMRDCIIHREGRLVVGGGLEPLVVIDFSRALVRGLPLHRQRISETTNRYSMKLAEFVQEILRKVDKW